MPIFRPSPLSRNKRGKPDEVNGGWMFRRELSLSSFRTEYYFSVGSPAAFQPAMPGQVLHIGVAETPCGFGGTGIGAAMFIPAVGDNKGSLV